jgi:hypothetical protein
LQPHISLGDRTYLFHRGDAAHLPLEDQSVDLVLGSPPYMDCRTYEEGGDDPGIARNCRAWVEWMLGVSREAVRVSRGAVLWVIGGKTRDRNYQPGPEGLVWEWFKEGGYQQMPLYWHKVGVPGKQSWFRKDIEYIIAIKGRPKLPWLDVLANGYPPKWGVGGEMSHRLSDGTLRNQWGHSGKGERADRRRDGSIGRAERPSHVIKAVGEARAAGSYTPPTLCNPGNLIQGVHVGGKIMGWHGCHENEAPYPEKLAAWLIRSLCPPWVCQECGHPFGDRPESACVGCGADLSLPGALRPGIVLDPFSGSGTTIRAALALGRRGIGIDIRQSQVDLGIEGVERPHERFPAPPKKRRAGTEG